MHCVCFVHMPPTLRRRVQRLERLTLLSLREQGRGDDKLIRDAKLWQFLQLVYSSPDAEDIEKISLPKVVDDPTLNRLIHLFMAAIVQNYIALWYLTKLNTDDPTFVVEVYHLFVEIARDVCGRITRVATADTALLTLYRVASTIETHFERANDDSYLNWGHPLVATSQADYLRLLTRKMLQATFSLIPNPSVTLDTTKIGNSLVQAVVADLVLAKTLEKLASPEFLRQIIHDLAKRAIVEKDSKRDSLPVSLWQRAQDAMAGIQQAWTKFSSIRKEGMKLEGIESSVDVLHHSVWSLLASMSNIQHRRPFVYYTICTGREVVKKIPWLHRWINHQINSVLTQSIDLTDPSIIASTIDHLRDSLFNDASPSKPPTTIPSSDETVDAVTTALMKVLQRLTRDNKFWFYQDETYSEYRAGVRNTLEVLEHCHSNKLLIIQLLDILVGELWDI